MKRCAGGAELLIPEFAKITNNELFLVKQKLGTGQAQSLHDFLKSNSAIQAPGQGRGASIRFNDRQIKKLVIDDVATSESSLATILQGAYS